jgi:hypothetical protein
MRWRASRAHRCPMERNIRSAPPPRQPTRPPLGEPSVWNIIAIAIAVVLCVGGLLYVAASVVFIIGLNHMAANK